MNIVNLTRYNNTGLFGIATVPIPATTPGNLLVVCIFNPISNGRMNSVVSNTDGQLTPVPRIGFGNGDPDDYWLNGIGNSLDIYYQVTSGGTVSISFNSDGGPSMWIFEIQPASFTAVAATGSLPGGSTQAPLIGPGVGTAVASVFTAATATDRFFTLAAAFNGPSGEFDVCLITSEFQPVTAVSSPWVLDTITSGISLGFIVGSGPPPIPPSCAPVDSLGTPVNGVLVSDLSLFIIPAYSLYDNLVPNSAIKMNETSAQGRKQIILDFNNTEGLYVRDFGTIFTWDLQSETVLDVWQPSIIPMDGEIYDRLSYHCLMTSLGSEGWQHAREMNIAYAAPAPLTLLLTFDQWPDISLTLPASVNEIKQKLTLLPNKFKLVEIFISSAQPFKLWTEDLEMKVKTWGSGDAYRLVRPVSG